MTLATTFSSQALAIRKAAGVFSRLRQMGGIGVFSVASIADREATRAVRHAVYCREKKFLGPDELFDGYDDRALILNALDGDQPVGTLRVTDSSEGPLEILEMHPEIEPLLPRDARILEVSRLMVVRSHRGLRATLPMFRRVRAEMVARGADALILSCARSLIPYYRDLLGFRLLSEQPLHHQRLRGLSDYPMILEPKKVLSQLNWRRLPVWALLDPMACLRAVVLTVGARMAAFFGGSPVRQIAGGIQ